MSILNLEQKGRLNGVWGGRERGGGLKEISTIFSLSLVHPSDPFLPSKGDGSQEGFIHIRIQQRNGRKTLTTVEGIGEQYDKKKIVRVCKKVCGRSEVC